MTEDLTLRRLVHVFIFHVRENVAPGGLTTREDRGTDPGEAGPASLTSSTPTWPITRTISLFSPGNTRTNLVWCKRKEDVPRTRPVKIPKAAFGWGAYPAKGNFLLSLSKATSIRSGS